MLMYRRNAPLQGVAVRVRRLRFMTPRWICDSFAARLLHRINNALCPTVSGFRFCSACN
jgi:hypothetical protein